MTYLGSSGLFDLPLAIWIWWGIDGLIIYLVGGVALGWAGHRFAATLGLGRQDQDTRAFARCDSVLTPVCQKMLLRGMPVRYLAVPSLRVDPA
jgi:hypothetical protein